MRRAGFTLIELMVVVVILGIAAATVSLKLTGSTQRARLRSAAVKIEQVLRQARHQAVMRHEPVWIVVEPTRIAMQEPQRDHHGAWHGLDARVARAMHRDAAAVDPAVRRFTLHLTPSGATLPWAMELNLGELRQSIWSDGVTGSVQRAEGGLNQIHWSRP